MSAAAPFAGVQHASAADGSRLTYSLLPASDGAPRVVLLHSLALDRRFWGAVAEAAQGRFALLAPDARGHGESEARTPATWEHMADDVAAVMDDAGWNRALIAGASMGGSVAVGFAARHPARTAGLLVVDCTAWYGPGAPEAWAKRAATAREGGMAALLPFQRARWLSPAFLAAHPEVQEAQEAVFLGTDVAGYEAACAMLGTLDLRAALPGIAAPTEVVVGSLDEATPPAMAEAIAAGVPGAALRVVEGAKHLLPLERPEEVVAALRRLAARAFPPHDA